MLWAAGPAHCRQRLPPAPPSPRRPPPLLAARCFRRSSRCFKGALEAQKSRLSAKEPFKCKRALRKGPSGRAANLSEPQQQQQQQPEVADSTSLGYTSHEFSEHAASPGAGFVGDSGEPVVVALTLNMDLSKVSDVEGLKKDVGADVSRALGPDVRQVPQKSPVDRKRALLKSPTAREPY